MQSGGLNTSPGVNNDMDQDSEHEDRRNINDAFLTLRGGGGGGWRDGWLGALSVDE